MKEIPLEELLPKSNWSIYRLSRMAATRALELADGKTRLVERESTEEKITTTALKEILQGKVVVAQKK